MMSGNPYESPTESELRAYERAYLVQLLKMRDRKEAMANYMFRWLRVFVVAAAVMAALSYVRLNEAANIVGGLTIGWLLREVTCVSPYNYYAAVLCRVIDWFKVEKLVGKS